MLNGGGAFKYVISFFLSKQVVQSVPALITQKEGRFFLNKVPCGDNVDGTLYHQPSRAETTSKMFFSVLSTDSLKW